MLTRRRPDDEGFTLIELIVTVAIVGIIVVSLAGVVLQYLKVSVTAQTRMNESPDLQFVAAYLQQDVSSLGVHSLSVPSSYFTQTQSVWTGATPSGVPAACSGLAGTVVGFVWNDYSTSTTDPNTGVWSAPTVNAAVYVAAPVGGQYQLNRVRCVGSTTTTITLAQRLTVAPSRTCSGGAVPGCDDPISGDAPPRVVSLGLTVADKSVNGASTTGYTPTAATVTGERRQS